MCGGTAQYQDNRGQREGLSPRVRGNPRSLSRMAQSLRSIPACAGEPRFAALVLTEGRVYPRVCGGTVITTPPLTSVVGLSPRVRGNPQSFGNGLPSGGSIPACAGEPLPLPGRNHQARVYPRVCGGTETDDMTTLAFVGLSPRVRGNRIQLAQAGGQHRSIPACAGEPRRCPR